MPTSRLILENIGELVTCEPRLGDASDASASKVGLIANACVVVEDDRIVWVGKQADFDSSPFEPAHRIDVSGSAVLPGFIDCHTHTVFAGNRDHEYEMRVSGATYMEIAESGGGINATVMAVRDSSEERLFELGLARLRAMIRSGTTTVEIKSGYGLSLEDELKMLRVIRRLNEESDLDIIPTFLGAHEFPPEYRKDRERYVDIVVEEMIPAVSELGLAEFCDVFCERGVFTPEQSRRIMVAAKEAGMKLTIHADEFEDSGGAELAAELGALSASHLGHASVHGLKAMKEAGTVAVVLPGVSFGICKPEFANARQMLEMGLEVALATDFNPGSSMVHALPIITSIACSFMRMTPAQAILAITKAAARALGREASLGSIEVGKQADLVILKAPSYRYVPYHLGGDLVDKVIKKGQIIYTA